MSALSLPGEVPVRCRAVAIAVLRGAGAAGTEVLLLRRAPGAYAGEWCLITGRMEAGEPAWRTAARETEEEAGVRLRALYSAGYCDSFYSPSSETLEVVPVFVGLVDPDAVITLNEENTGFRWVTIPEAIELVPFHGHRIALDAIARDFAARPPGEWRRVTQYRP
ncbi:MAG: NUDIX domain-containing protein [Alphaproteobacteria bacterium]|nr:NUDIX domain-containing protein [Alphaproteobacteria bacterium]